jgi:hypothetical protein
MSCCFLGAQINKAHSKGVLPHATTLLALSLSCFILAGALFLSAERATSIVDYGVGENRGVHLKKIAGRCMGSQQVRGRITITLAPADERLSIL